MRAPDRVPTANHELDALQASLERWAREIPDGAQPIGAPRVVSGDGALRFGDLALVRAQEALTLSLPVPSQEDIGRTLALMITEGAATVTLDLGGSTVNGSATHTVGTAYSVRWLVAVGAKAWGRLL